MMPERFGKYEDVEKIGEGGFGEVYKGFDPHLKRFVAIKTCWSKDRQFLDRFSREAEIAAQLQHPNVTTVHDFGYQGETPYLVQEYLNGEDLDDKITRCEPVELRTKLDYLRQIASGLQYAHAQGVIHRDVKPANVRILDDGQVKIMDFGIAKLMSSETAFTQTGMSVGTAGYLPPEQIRGEPVDLRADIFSFGVLAYELLTYRQPFSGNSISNILYRVAHVEPRPVVELWPECPPALANLIETCLEKDPVNRYADFSEVITKLEALSGRVGSEPTPVVAVAPVNENRFQAPAPRLGARATVREDVRQQPAAGTGSHGGPAYMAEASTPADADTTGLSGQTVRLSDWKRAQEQTASGDRKQRTRGLLARILPIAGLLLVAGALTLFALWNGEEESTDESEETDTSSPEESGTSPPEEPGTQPPEEPSPPEETGTQPVEEPSPPEEPGTQPGEEPSPPEEPGAQPGEEPDPITPPSPPTLSDNARFLVLITGDADSGVPTAETHFLAELERHGFRIVDADRRKAISDDEIALATAGEADPLRLAAIGGQSGAEVVVTGRLQSEAEPSFGKFHTGRAVLEIRTYLTATGRYLGIRTVRKGDAGSQGALESSGMMARDAAVEDVARRGAEAIVEQVRDAMAEDQELSVVVYGATVDDARRLRELLASMTGIRNVWQRTFVAGERLELGVDYEGDPMALGEALHQHRIGSRRLALQSSENWSLTLEMQ